MLDKVVGLLDAFSPQWCEGEHSLTAKIKLNEDTLINLRVGADLGVIDSDLLPQQLKGRRRRRESVNNLDHSDFGREYEVSFITDSDVKLIKDFKSLVKKHPVIHPDVFVLTNDSDGYARFPCDEPKGKLKHYLEISNIWRLLQSKSDDSDENKLVFLYRKKLEIQSSYNVNILDDGFDGLTKLNSLLEKDDKHDVEKSHILQNLLFSTLSNIKLEDRFTHLLSHFTMFSLKFDESYQAYVVGFSFDELRSDYEEKYRDYLVKINDLVSGTLTKSLTIPAAVFLTSTRTQAIQSSKATASSSELLAVNMGMLFVALLVSVVFCMMALNEFHSLSSIKLEYQSLMRRLREKSTDAFEAVESLQKNLDSRIIYAKTVLVFLFFTSLIHGVISFLWVSFRSAWWSIPSLEFNSVGLLLIRLADFTASLILAILL